MSDVESFWYTLAAKFGSNRKWNELSAVEQNHFINSINTIIFILNTSQKGNQNEV